MNWLPWVPLFLHCIKREEGSSSWPKIVSIPAREDGSAPRHSPTQHSPALCWRPCRERAQLDEGDNFLQEPTGENRGKDPLNSFSSSQSLDMKGFELWVNSGCTTCRKPSVKWSPCQVCIFCFAVKYYTKHWITISGLKTLSKMLFQPSEDLLSVLPLSPCWEWSFRVPHTQISINWTPQDWVLGGIDSCRIGR